MWPWEGMGRFKMGALGATRRTGSSFREIKGATERERHNQKRPVFRGIQTGGGGERRAGGIVSGVQEG